MTTFIFGFIFSTLGIGYFIYGKKQQQMIPLIAGTGLCIFPYFISNLYIMMIIGAILLAGPWILRE